MSINPKGILIIFCLVTSINLSVFGIDSDEFRNQNSAKIESILSASFEIYQSGLNQKAYQKGVEAFQYLDSSISNELEGKVYNYVGNYALESELYNEAIQHYNSALEAYIIVGKSSKIASVYGNMAVVFEKLKKPDLSLQYNFKALDFHISNKDSNGISTAFTNIGNTYSDMGEFNLCRNYFIKALFIDSVLKDTTRISTDYNNLGNLHSVLKNDEIAVKYYIASLELDEKMDNAMGQCITLFNIGSAYFELGNVEDALINSKKSYALAQKLKSVNYLLKNANLLSKIYSTKKNDKVAYRYFQEFNSWSDSLEIKKKEALLYAKQLENNKQTAVSNVFEAKPNQKMSLDKILWLVLRVVIYIGMALAISYLGYKVYVLFTNQ